MEAHRQLTDQEFESTFSDLSFKPQSFTHEAHLRLAWIHINKYGIEQAEENVSKQIYAFAKSLSAESKFHKTVTVAAVKAVAHFMGKSDSKDFQALLTEFPRLKSEFKELMNAHYSGNIFEDESARKAYKSPDLIPFD